jgi:1,2-diacylglycerol 3-alpha-glucosyltransferase
MNIGIVTTWFERGAAVVSKQYMESLQDKHNVFIYARGGESYAKGNPDWDFPNVTWGAKTFFQTNGTPISKKDFKKWIKQNSIDILFFNEQQWWIPVIWAKEWGITVGSYIDYYTEETVPFFALYDFLICNTKRHYSAFDWHINCFYVPWGTNIDLYIPNNKIKDQDKLVFFNSAGHNPDRKGVGPLLLAFDKLSSDNVKLIIHTQVNLKKFYPELSDIIEKLFNDNKLEVIKETIGAPGIYHLADVYCYISKLDGIGLTVPEAISCGLPVIVPNHPPMNEFVQDAVNGKLVEIKKQYCRKDAYYWPQIEVSEKSLLECLIYYVDNMEKIKKLKIDSRNYAIKNLNWNDRKKELENIFELVKHTSIDIQLVKKIKFYETKVFLQNLYMLPVRIYKNLKR